MDDKVFNEHADRHDLNGHSILLEEIILAGSTYQSKKHLVRMNQVTSQSLRATLKTCPLTIEVAVPTTTISNSLSLLTSVKKSLEEL